MTTPWTLLNADEEYADFHAHIPDSGGVGVRVDLTLHLRRRWAAMATTVDNPDGTHFARSETHVPWDVATRMVADAAREAGLDLSEPPGVTLPTGWEGVE